MRADDSPLLRRETKQDLLNIDRRALRNTQPDYADTPPSSSPPAKRNWFSRSPQTSSGSRQQVGVIASTLAGHLAPCAAQQCCVCFACAAPAHLAVPGLHDPCSSCSVMQICCLAGGGT